VGAAVGVWVGLTDGGSGVCVAEALRDGVTVALRLRLALAVRVAVGLGLALPCSAR
jgi:hypothetical protein